MGKPKRISGVALLWMLLAGLAGADGAQAPLNLPNRFPLHLMFLAPRLVGAQLPEKGALEAELAVDYSSVYLDERSDAYAFLLDMETVVMELSLAYRLTRRLGLRLHVPMVSMNSGFLDGFLEGYHDALGVSNYGRENRPANHFAYRTARDGQPWVDGATGDFGWADLTVSAQWSLLPFKAERRWQSSLLASIKAPTGDPDHGYGSGRWDAGLFLPTQWDLGRWSLHLMPGIMHHEDPETLGARIAARESFSLSGGAAYAYNARWTWLAQLNYFTSPIAETGVSRIDNGALELAVGFRHTFDRNFRIEVAFVEDPLILAAPDFTLHVGVVWTPALCQSGRRG